MSTMVVCSTISIRIPPEILTLPAMQPMFLLSATRRANSRLILISKRKYLSIKGCSIRIIWWLSREDCKKPVWPTWLKPSMMPAENGPYNSIRLISKWISVPRTWPASSSSTFRIIQDRVRLTWVSSMPICKQKGLPPKMNGNSGAIILLFWLNCLNSAFLMRRFWLISK